MTPKDLGMAALYCTDEQGAAVVKEVVEDHYSPAELGKEFQISAWKITDLVRIAGHGLPESYGKETQSGSATGGQY